MIFKNIINNNEHILPNRESMNYKDKLKKLLEMGFDGNESMTALKTESNNFEKARQILSESKTKFETKLEYDKTRERAKAYDTLKSFIVGNFDKNIGETFNDSNPDYEKISQAISQDSPVDTYSDDYTFRDFDSNKIEPINSNNFKTNNISNRVTFNKCNVPSYSGDSIVESITKGGIIMNPANAYTIGGGTLNGKPHKAMEENLCRQSDLFTSLMLFQKAHEPYLTTADICLVSNNYFKYLKSDNVNDGYKFGKLKDKHNALVLSIASPDMKHIKDHSHNKNIYFNIMIKYWMLALYATKEYYQIEGIKGIEGTPSTPKLIAVMPGDFIKYHALGRPRDSLTIIAAKALRIALNVIPGVDVCFARQTRETMICETVLKSSSLNIQGLYFYMMNISALGSPSSRLTDCNNEDTVYRFIKAQLFGVSNSPPGCTFEEAFNELETQGKKTLHYIWYVMPQINGLGTSSINQFYSIKNHYDVKAYMRNDFLRNNYFTLY